MIKRMFGLIKKMFIGLLVSTVNVSNHTKCASLNNQQCMVQFNEYSQGLRYYPFAVKWDRLDVWEVVILFMIYLIKYV